MDTTNGAGGVRRTQALPQVRNRTPYAASSWCMANPLRAPHDRLFRKVFRRTREARGLLEAALPSDLLRELDLDSLRFIGTQLIDDKLHERISDLLFSCRRRDQTVFLYPLIEHKSSLDGRPLLQVLGYQLHAWELLEKERAPDQPLPEIYPLLVYHGDPPVPSTWRFRDLFERTARTGPAPVDYELIVVDLQRWSDNRLLRVASGSPLAALTLLLLKNARSGRYLGRIEGWGHLFRELRGEHRGSVWINVVLHYSLTVDARCTSLQPLRAAMERILGPSAGDMVMTLGERLIQQGVEKGIEKGVLMERRRGVLIALESRFGPVPPEIREVVERNEDLRSLDGLHVLALRCRSLDEFRGSAP